MIYKITSALASVALLLPCYATETAQVRTVHPEASDVPSLLTGIGRTEPAQQAQLFSRATGTVSECKADIGDVVKMGDVLAFIDAPEVAHQIAAAKAKVLQTKTRAYLAKVLQDRSAELIKTHAVSQQDIDQTRAATATAEADEAVAIADLGGYEEKQRFLTIHAPFDGTITARKIDPGTHVNGDAAGADAWLFTISRLDELRMVLSVPPSTALRIRNGLSAEMIFSDLPGKVVQGKVDRFSSVIESASGTMRVELLLPNNDFAVPAGLSGVAKINAPAASTTLLLPANVLITRQGVTQVVLVQEGKVKYTAVKTGRTLGPKIEILSGVQQTNEVILSPNALLQDGDPVTATLVEQPKKTS